MKIRKIAAMLMAMAMLVSVFASCATGGTGSSTADNSTVSEGSTAADSSTAATSDAETADIPTSAITASITQEPPDMNTITSTASLAHALMKHIYVGLTAQDTNDNVIPGVAESWEESEDKLTYTFHLRKDAKWSNGDPVTANDFYFAWSKLIDPEIASEYAYFAFIIAGAEDYYNGEGSLDDVKMKVVDDYTFEVTLVAPTPYALDSFAFGSFMPVNEKFYEEVGADKYSTEAEYFCTNGAYKVDSWAHEDNFVISKDPNFYDAANQAKIGTITFKIINDSATALNAFKAGELDLVYGLTGDQAAQVRAEGGTVKNYNDGSTWYLMFNNTSPELSNVKIRKALGLAIDKQAFIDSIIKNSSEPATSFVPSGFNGLNGYFADEVGELFPAAPQIDEAKKLLAEGLEEANMTMDEFNQSIGMLTDDTPTATLIGAFVQEQLRTALGVELNVESMTYKERLDRMTKMDFDIVFAGWGPDYNDPNTYLDLWTTTNGNNDTGYSSAEYDAEIAAAAKETDPEKRFAHFYNVENLIAQDVPVYPIYWRKTDYVENEKLSNVVRTIFQDLNFVYADLAE